MKRILSALSVAALLAACSPSGEDLDKPAVPLGDFALGHNVVVAPKAVKGPLSRDVSQEEWEDSLKDAIGARFSRYGGDKLYHFGVSVEGYVLAAPGVPLVVSPKSILIINVTVWDDAAGQKLNDEPAQLTIFETTSEKTLVGSGLTQSREQQLRNLSVNAAKQIEIFLQKQIKSDGWFGGEAGEVAVLAEPDAAATPTEAIADAVE